MSLHLWIIPLLALTGGAINGLFGRRFDKKTVNAVGLAFVGAAFVMALWVAWRFASLPEDSIPYVERFASWIRAGDFSADFAFYLDQLSLVMLLVVTGVGFLIHIYSAGYMAHEGGYYRYFSYLNLFMFFMLTLVLANNYLLMFIGWEGVGLASYLLIGFFFRRDSASSAGKKAFIVNRIGDFGFLIGLFLLIRQFHTLNFDRVFREVSKFGIEKDGVGLMTTVGLLLLVGATGKSAQIPLYVWLPDAMEGPTPVSALIHAATMVTAGVYMVARSHPIFDRAPTALMAVAIIGCVTALYAATIGIAQTDIKKVLAYSTISQLGYMFLACGVAAYSAGIFHLMTHAFFKGLLFLAAGSVIHSLGGEQDMRRMGGLRREIPVTFWCMTAATFAIAGAPLFSGFFSKDQILWKAWSSPYGSWIYWLVAVFTAFLTAFYMFRLWFLTFFGEFRGEAHPTAEPAAHVHKDVPALPDEISIEVAVPDAFTEAAKNEVIRRKGLILHLFTEGEGPAAQTTIKAQVPTRRVDGLESWLRDQTKGRASYTIREAKRAYTPEMTVPHGFAHESPKVMLLPMILLAVLSVAGGWVGWPRAIGGSNHFDHFLSPVFKVSAEAMPAGTMPGEPRPEAAEEHAEQNMELLLTAVSVGAAFLGFLLAWYLYHRRRELPQRIAEQLGSFYRTVVNKYYVDEIYAVLLVKPLIYLSTVLLWQDIDVTTIDGAVNESAGGAREISDTVRHMQSGNVRSYAGWVAAGAAVVVVYMIWSGLR
jgi:proton-translocating NADH-quinone oxidoreductase chain L